MNPHQSTNGRILIGLRGNEFKAPLFGNAGDRKLGGADLKALCTPLAEEAGQLHAKYLPEIQQRASTLDTTSILNLVRGRSAV